MAGGSALLTLIILCGFAGVVGALISERIHSDFDDQISNSTQQLASSLEVQDVQPYFGQVRIVLNRRLDELAADNDAQIRIVTANGRDLRSTGVQSRFGPPTSFAVESHGYRVETARLPDAFSARVGLGPLFLQYGRPVKSTEATIRRVRLFLVIGVLSGTGLALLAGLTIARRAMAPITELTATAREIERTRDPGRRVPEPDADDEVAELARTLDQMLRALDASRTETEAALARQREFVADASHELRTPLTSVLANLELLADHLEGEPREAASSALRSSQRMRRLVADLLLLARADAERAVPHTTVDLGDVLVEAAAEVGALADDHELDVEPAPAAISGARDELHRLALNLMQNAIAHTPAGTRITASVRVDGDVVRLTVTDDGPGIPAEIRDRVFERFVRGAGDRGGSVRLQSPVADGHGTRFDVELPAAARPAPAPAPVA